MERYFFRRGKRVAVDEIEGVVALELETDGSKARSASPTDFGQLAASGAERAFDLSADEAAAFEDANWVFVKPTPQVRTMESWSGTPPGIRKQGKVVRNSDGRICVLTDELVVQLKPEISHEEARAKLRDMGLEVVRDLKFAANMFEARTVDGVDAIDKALTLVENSDVTLAEPSLVQSIARRLRPTDPEYSEQWQWSNDGSGGGIAGADVNVEAAWDQTMGGGVKVAIIDNGFDADHPDLAAGVSAQSGYFDRHSDFHIGTVGMPDEAHGTFCAGMAGARQGNDQGGCGAAPECDLMLIATLNDQVGTQATLARAVAYAADPTLEDNNAEAGDGADIVSCSLGPSSSARWALEAALEAAIDFAVRRGRGGLGCAVFWAVSNGNVEIRHDEVCSDTRTIAVGRSTRSDTENNSGYGPELDFLAPGVSVYNANSGGGYRTWTGTSFAAPCAAGVGALGLAVNADLTADQLRQIMRDTCDKIGGVTYDANTHHLDYGHGRINAECLVAAAKSAAGA